MPTIVDSLFLELGIDTSKFSKDQSAALAKIAQFEAQTKRAAGNSRDGIKSVGSAFRELANDSRVGASAGAVDSLAAKFKNLGISMSASGGAAGGIGSMALGIGRLLSPMALGAAAVAVIGKEMWDLNRATTGANASIFRQSQLSDMNAKSLWSWGEAAKAAGANPQEVTGGISSLQTAIAGMGIGAADATPQLIAMARLGIKSNFKSGLSDDQVTQMFEIVHNKAKASGYKNLGALTALTSSFMNPAMQAIAFDPEFDPKKLKGQIEASAPANLNKVLQDSLKSQMALGKLDIDEDILKQTAYGGEQGLMMSVVEILRSLLGEVTKITDFLIHPVDGVKNAWNSVVNSFGVGGRMSSATSQLMGMGYSQKDAAAIVGNLAQESKLDPFASNRGHLGIGQWDSERQADFFAKHHYRIGDKSVGADQQLADQLQFINEELHGKRRAALNAMMKAQSVAAKTKLFQDLYEVPGNDGSLGKRLGYANYADMAAAANSGKSSVNHTSTSETHVGDIHIHTSSTDPVAHGNIVRKGIASPIATPDSQAHLSLSTRAQTG